MQASERASTWYHIATSERVSTWYRIATSERASTWYRNRASERALAIAMSKRSYSHLREKRHNLSVVSQEATATSIFLCRIVFYIDREGASEVVARLAMGMALATISLENGSPWLAAKKTATSVPWYVVLQEAMTTKVDCDEGCEIAPRNNQPNILHRIARTRATSRHCDTRLLIARKTTMIVSFMLCCERSNNHHIFDVASSGRIAREPATTVI